jgi:hypothetical protein
MTGEFLRTADFRVIKLGTFLQLLAVMAIHSNELRRRCVCVCVEPTEQNSVSVRKKQQDIILQQMRRYGSAQKGEHEHEDVNTN